MPIIGLFFLCVDSLCLSSWDFSIEHVFASVYPAIWQVCSDDICSVASDPSDHSYFAGRISSVAGMLMFGNGFGLLYSCIGLVIGKQSDFACPLLWRSLCPAYFIAKKYQKFDELLTRKRKILKSTSCYLVASLCARRLDLSSSWFDEIIFREFMQIVIFLKPWSVVCIA